MWIIPIILMILIVVLVYYVYYYRDENLLLQIKYDEALNIINEERKTINDLKALNRVKDNSKDLLKEINELNIILDDKEAHIISLDNDITHLKYLLKSNSKTNSNRSLKQQNHAKNKEESFYTKVVGIYKPYHFVEKEFLKDLEMLIKIKHLKS